ncbi:hypothetical protein [Vibrio cidicii]|uniref:hypothetical protein n=2 Tax=Vibrio cidicii TaxID=1763883 RepID=UPI0018C1D359|nr:hypothetical protein [Vibrio cidicii]MBG0757602.1 hypothetical protein [Vibrio cidicii]
MSSENVLVITKHPMRLVFDRTANTGTVNIHCEENNLCLIVSFLTASLMFLYNELDLDYSLNLSTRNTLHGLTFDEIESILSFYDVAARYSLSVEASK